MTVLPVSAPRRQRYSVVALVAVAVLAAVVVLGLVAGLTWRAFGAATGARPLAGGVSTCVTDPSAATSDQGRQYLRDVSGAQPSWDAVTASIQARKGRAQRSDVVAQAAGDRLFLAELTDKASPAVRASPPRA